MNRDAVVGDTAREGAVLASCADTADEIHGGHWRCLTHDADHPNNLTRESHAAEPGEHVLAWICHAHGPEVP